MKKITQYGIIHLKTYVVICEMREDTAPFKKVTEKIMTEFSDLNLCPINNRQGIVIDGEGSKVICKD